MKTFEFSYTKGSGDIRVEESKYYEAENLLRAYIQFLTDIGYSKEQIEEEFQQRCYLEDEITMIHEPGEWRDEISSGGSWMYFDLVGQEINKYSIPVTVTLQYGHICGDVKLLGEAALREFKRKGGLNINKTTIDITGWKLKYEEEEDGKL